MYASTNLVSAKNQDPVKDDGRLPDVTVLLVTMVTDVVKNHAQLRTN